MKQNNIFEVLLSAAVILVAGGFLWFANSSTGGASFSDYELVADMANASGLTAGSSDVLLAGTKIGTVSELTLDPKTYRAIAHLRLRGDIQIPVDSALIISTALMSPQASLSIAPGRSGKMLPPGGVIRSNRP
jgi:phospholipid/cholesterol/gamma-HCH transport system substrate-binding protein